MNYTVKQNEIYTEKEVGETRIVSLNNLNWDKNLSHSDIQDLIVKINDLLPNYTFILGNICNYHLLDNSEFRNKIIYFFKLLSCISKSYIVFGNNDFTINQENKKAITTIDKLIEFYSNLDVCVLNNNFYSVNNYNIYGYNRIPNNIIDNEKTELINYIYNIKNNLDISKFNIFLSHFEINNSKLEKELLETFDLILTGSNHNIIKKKFLFFYKDIEEEELENNQIIKTGGINHEKFNFIKIKRI